MQNFLSKHPLLARLARLARVRMADWMITALVLWALVALVAPHQLEVSIYKMSLVAIAAVAGYWIDRSLFPYARPDLFFDLAEGKPEGAPPETSFTDLSGALSFSEHQTANALGGASRWELMEFARAAMVRRAVIVAAAMVAVSLGA